MTVKEAFKKFIRSRQQKGCSDQTIKSYGLLTAHFIGFVGGGTEMEELTQEQLEDFLDFLYDRKLSRASVASYIRNTKIFLCWYEKNMMWNIQRRNFRFPGHRKRYCISTPRRK